ncbi:Leucine-rich repeat protein kinase family protein [Forsythia ovata]|uniref:Leucine-rich repeat protein kinase family protein n=1 Tax=Forsythia ovata TaxID=205694 RepID=A0ABD1PIL4_9LAMI
MQVRELENPETSGLKTAEKSEESEESESLEENSSKKDLGSESIIDVSGKVLDFPLLEVVESTVEGLYMYKNRLNLIPRAVGRLKGLKTLKFFANELILFPGEFKNLVELECLQVKVAAPGVSGLELSKMKNLKELELSRVPPRPSAFPILSEIAGLKCLTRLSVCHFSIRYLPPEISCLNKLEFLDLSFNKMRNLPDEIVSLSSLISLKVANNKLVELPSGLSSLQRLENLDLSNNRLTSLGFLELRLMHNLQSLNLQHNNLRSCCQIPPWICCNLEGNSNYILNDESAEMDVYQGVVQENDNCPSNSSSITPRSHLTGLSPNNRCLAARRTKGRKWRCNLQPRNRQERLNYSKKWKLEAVIQNSSEKCMACRMSVLGDNSLAEGSAVLAAADVDNKESFSGGDVYESSLIDIENVDVNTKETVVTCSCSAIDTVGIHKEVEGDCSESGATLGSLSDTAKVLDEGSSSETSNSIMKSKRHSEKDLDNPKPTKSRRPTNEPLYLSCQYSKISFCGVDDHLPDGFFDAGRDRPFMPLSSYEQNFQLHSREVILVDRERDEDLDSVLLCARALVYHFKQMNGSIDEREHVAIDNLQIASLLALFVSDHFGGSDKSVALQRIRKAVSGSNYRKPFVCTCPTGTGDNIISPKQGVDNVEDIVFLDLCEKSLQSIKARLNSIIVPIGGLQFGVCRHRAVLMKYLCDRMEPRIPCELVRGYLDFLPHAWNVIVIKRGESWVRMIVDACHPHDIREETDPEYFCRYVPLSRIISPVAADGATSPNCSFPSLSVCDEIGKVGSTTLMRCNFGSLEAAVKVRTAEVRETSADEIRNFEFSCLGEIRMLGVLKHSCIVEFYGHQISSTWSLSADGNYGGRIIRSAILMEYIEGGSLKSYVEKLSRDGQKHVAVDLSLFIARDVAFALTELHSKHIIHRDIKSENILIDLDKKRPDGTPIIKICDFDRAIPLRSCLHTCCIAHVGIPPPDTCVGTPRWMAPEVFRAMHRRNMYGLEVDIWSFGCLLLELLTLQVPYSGLSESEIHNLLQMGERPRLTEELEVLAQSDKELETDSETLKFLVKLYHQCTEKNLSDRPTAENLYNMLLARASSISVSRSSKQE